MRQIRYPYEIDSSTLLGWLPNAKPRQIDRSLSEDDILFLQDIFLKTGFHHIRVADILSGRTIMYKLLESIHYYHEITCLTGNLQIPLKRRINNLYQALEKCCGSHATYESIEEYFLENYYADFLWIELSEELFKKSIATCALSIMHQLGMADNIPIISISYNS